ncbi:MAG: DNA-binding transcriptional regulator [Gammaproteobacteria bacterium]|nr:DNA-binding transcriptional regulator [Gammaproteobacteria bacterium]
MKNKKNKILEVMHDTAKGLNRAGLMDAETMAEFDVLCLPPVKKFTAAQIKKLRKSFSVSQPVFAAYLNTSPNTIKQWEQGIRNPNSIALKMLNLISHKGLSVLNY